jgi:ankyrin repeat protein
VEYLVITRRQDPNKSPGGLCSPLHAAAFLGRTAIARFLLEHTADVNARDKYHPTPLHKAVERGNLDITQLLLGYGADVNVLDHS